MNEQRRRRPRRRRGRRGPRGNPQRKNRGPEMMVDEEANAILKTLHSVSELIELRPAELLDVAKIRL